jgi:capping protein beta
VNLIFSSYRAFYHLKIFLFRYSIEVETDAKSGRDFIKSEYNRDGDSHRSPWSNEYFPALEEGNVPSERARNLEVKANFLFDEYRKM